MNDWRAGSLWSAHATTAFKVLTEEEVRALDAILKGVLARSQEEGEGDPLFHAVDASGVNPFPDARTQSEVYKGLARKGLIACSGSRALQGGGLVVHVFMTPKGWEALKAARSVN